MSVREITPELAAQLTRGLSAPEWLPSLAHKLMQPMRRIPTGWPELDDALCAGPGAPQGLVVPSLVVLGAQPKIGKSIWCQYLLQHHVKDRGQLGILVDFENGKERSTRRMLQRQAEVSDPDLGDHITALKKKRMMEAMDYWNDPNFVNIDDRTLTPDKLEEILRSYRLRFPDKEMLVVIDSLQKAPMKDLNNRRSGIDDWVRRLEGMREPVDAAILAVSELTRPKGDGKNKEYKADGMSYKESGDIEYSCDLGLDMVEVDKENMIAKLVISWNRDGTKTGPVAKYQRIKPYYGMEESRYLDGSHLTKNLRK